MNAISAGHICLDIIPDLSAQEPGQFGSVFQPGRLVNVGPAALSTGGSVSNTGLALHKLGIETRLIARVGADEFGRTVRRLVAARAPGLEAGISADPLVSTSYSVVISPPDVDRIFLHHPGANDNFSAADVKSGDIRDARLFHFGYPPVMAGMYANNGAQLEALFRRVKALGLTSSLDLAYPDPASPAGRADWHAILQKTLPFVDIFTPSLDEILFMLGRETDTPLSEALLAQVSQELIGMGAKIVLLKLGDRGLYLRTAPPSVLKDLGRVCSSDLDAWGNIEIWSPCFQVDVAGTTGAGDVTTAGFLAALLRDLPPAKAVDFALAAGACCVEAADAFSGLRTWDETWKRINAGWERREPK
ncbi:MAG: carbohydrate kinase family protein [Anaerolineaceae bacterium]